MPTTRPLPPITVAHPGTSRAIVQKAAGPVSPELARVFSKVQGHRVIADQPHGGPRHSLLIPSQLPQVEASQYVVAEGTDVASQIINHATGFAREVAHVLMAAQSGIVHADITADASTEQDDLAHKMFCDMIHANFPITIF